MKDVNKFKDLKNLYKKVDKMEKEEIECLKPLFYDLLLNPDGYVVDKSESNVVNFDAGVTSSKVKIVGAYFTRQVEFIEIVRDTQILFIFRAD